MKQLGDRGKSIVSEEQCAAAVMESGPLIMRTIVCHMRSRAPAGVTVPQFRTLIFLSRHEGACLSDVTAHSGLTLATMSKVIDVLVKRGLVLREVSPEDRRRITLALTPEGRETLDRARRHTRSRVAEMLAVLSPAERKAVVRAMECLRTAFSARM
jgi:DNA-binding MarR family transcriptional regulator